jgi:hypothetical protein
MTIEMFIIILSVGGGNGLVYFIHIILQLGLLWKISKTIGAREPSTAALRAVRFGVESAQALQSRKSFIRYIFSYIFNQNKNVKEYLFYFKFFIK